MKTDWISVNESLPSYGQHVFVVFTSNNRRFTKVGMRRFTDQHGEHWDVFGNSPAGIHPDHWMPLPEPPEDFKLTNNKTNKL